MPSKKKAPVKKKKITIGVEVLPPQKKHIPAKPFTAASPQAKKWYRGMPSPNPSGGPKRDGLRLVSRALRVQLNLQAPRAECAAVGLKSGSWAQVVAAAILRQSVRGDMGAARLLLDFTEKVNIRIDVPLDDDGNPITIAPPSLNIVFTDTPAGESLLRQDLLGDGRNGGLPPGD